MRRRFWLELLVFVVLLVALDRCLFAVLNTGFRRVTVGESGGMVNRARQVQADVVVVGSSRAWRHYDTEVLSRELKATAYNAGCDGQGPPYVRGLVDLLVKDHPPRILLIDAEPAFMIRSDRYADRVTVLAPYIGESVAIRDMIYRRGVFEPLKYLCLSFRFNSKPLAILGNLRAKDSTVWGFNPLNRTADPAALDDQAMRNVQGNFAKGVCVDEYQIGLLRETIRTAKASGSRVVLVASPKWDPDGKAALAEGSLVGELTRLASQEAVPYLPITQQTSAAFLDPALFADAMHLNRAGAKLFTEILVKALRSQPDVPRQTQPPNG